MRAEWTYSQLVTSQLFTPGWREAIMVKCLAQGHKSHDRIRTHTLLLTTPELWSDELDRLATTRLKKQVLKSNLIHMEWLRFICFCHYREGEQKAFAIFFLHANATFMYYLFIF